MRACYEGVLPPCDHPGALNKIAKRLSWKEGTFWNSDLTFINFEKIRETAFRSWATSSVVASRVGGTVRPSILAVEALITNSNLVECSTGKSAGLRP